MKQLVRFLGTTTLALVLSLALAVCANDSTTASASPPSTTLDSTTFSTSQIKIFLYGEEHGKADIMDKEFELWYKHYHDEGMRHLFLEVPYFSAQYLNLWMKSDSDEILDALYDDLEGTLSHTPAINDFYKKIKSECPQTVFHGTDVGHQYESTGERYLQYLQSAGLENSHEFQLAQEATKQGETYYNLEDEAALEYRESMMVANFIREFDGLDGKSIMGIYGDQHTTIGGFIFNSKRVTNMATQLDLHYVGAVQSVSLVPRFNLWLLLPAGAILVGAGAAVIFALKNRKKSRNESAHLA
jgi:hypothetical protein